MRWRGGHQAFPAYFGSHNIGAIPVDVCNYCRDDDAENTEERWFLRDCRVDVSRYCILLCLRYWVLKNVWMYAISSILKVQFLGSIDYQTNIHVHSCWIPSIIHGYSSSSESDKLSARSTRSVWGGGGELDWVRPQRLLQPSWDCIRPSGPTWVVSDGHSAYEMCDAQENPKHTWLEGSSKLRVSFCAGSTKVPPPVISMDSSRSEGSGPEIDSLKSKSPRKPTIKGVNRRSSARGWHGPASPAVCSRRALRRTRSRRRLARSEGVNKGFALVDKYR
mgnify:CR=1 FL=1